MNGSFIAKLGVALSKIKKLFLRRKKQTVVPETVVASPPEIASPPIKPQTATTTQQADAPVALGRPPRLWNIGLDFGTAYTKCVVRDLATEESFLVPLHGSEYLLPSEVFCGNRFVWLHVDEQKEKSPARVLHLKMALADVSSGRFDSHWIEEFKRTTGSSDQSIVPGHVEALTVYFLARVIQRAKAFILTRSPDFSEALGDRYMVNMAMPVAHAQEIEVNMAFRRCLSWAFLLAREANLPRFSAEEIQAALIRVGEPPEQDIGCYVYPEVSANVQSYVKSRAGVEGLYLFMDVGAGTVDVSIFIYYPHESNDRPFSYPSAGVIPLGSSQIEMRVARNLNGDGAGTVAELQEIVRRIKEGHDKHNETITREIRAAQSEIEDEMYHEVAPILGTGRTQIHANQWGSLKMLIGGGGAETPLYRKAVDRWFDQFSHFTPELRPIPLPTDLQWPTDVPEARRGRLFRRLSVAYGLSFDRANLEDHRFPRDIPPLPVKDGATSEVRRAPTKEDC